MDSNPTFADEVARRRIDADEWDDIYVVGDVHGCLTELESLLETLGVNDDDDLVVFVGDLIRKGPDSLGVLELVQANDNLLSVRGNNEVPARGRNPFRLRASRTRVRSVTPSGDFVGGHPRRSRRC
nr:metallophosphoesterase [Haladaptatus cibarius]